VFSRPISTLFKKKKEKKRKEKKRKESQQQRFLAHSCERSFEKVEPRDVTSGQATPNAVKAAAA
jgi:transposase-like protein